LWQFGDDRFIANQIRELHSIRQDYPRAQRNPRARGRQREKDECALLVRGADNCKRIRIDGEMRQEIAAIVTAFVKNIFKMVQCTIKVRPAFSADLQCRMGLAAPNPVWF
jgi:hypothetical protein